MACSLRRRSFVVFTPSRRANSQLRSSSGALAPVCSVAQSVSIRIGFTRCARTDDGSTELSR